MTFTKSKNRSGKSNNKNRISISGRISQFIFQKFFMLCIGFVVIATILLSPKPDLFIESNLVEGDISPKNIWAPRDLSVEDTKTTDKKKKDVLENTPSIYDYDERSIENISLKISNAFKQLRIQYNKLQEIQPPVESDTNQSKEKNVKTPKKEQLAQETPEVDEVKAKTIEKIKLDMEHIISSELGMSAPKNTEILAFFIEEKVSEELENYIRDIFSSLLKRIVVDNKISFQQDLEKGIQMNYLHSKRKIRIKPEESTNVLDVNTAKAEIESVINKTNLKESDKENLKILIISLLRPNLTFNKSETEKAKLTAVEKIEPVFFTFKKGQMIIRERDKITEDHILIFNSIKQKFDLFSYILKILGLALLILMLISLAFLILNDLSKIFRGNFKNHLIFVSIIIFYILISKSQIWLSNSIADSVQNESFHNLPSYFFLLPMSLGPILSTLLIDFPTGLIMVFVSSFFTGIILSSNPDLVIQSFIVGFVACFWIRKYNSRTGIMKTGLIVGLFKSFFVLFIALQLVELKDWNVLAFDMSCGFFGGILASLITLVALPAFEQIFKVTTDIKLLELSDTNNPTLKKLAVNAPGTFSHTMRVAELSEAAAQEINANHILARVAALYHDIGKMNKSSYFVENFRFNEKNPHDRLNPNMSRTIILSHVKEGQEIAEEQGLPDSIIDAIKQHQGTGLITVFYKKAQELAKEKDENVVEGDFRYPGPKPQTKEMAIIMLADGIEAASRTLVDPTPASIKTFIAKMFERVIMDGQLDECPLTLRELAKIQNIFVQRITTAFHQRLDYPGVSFEGKKKRERSDDSKQSESGETQTPKDEEDSSNHPEHDEG